MRRLALFLLSLPLHAVPAQGPGRHSAAAMPPARRRQPGLGRVDLSALAGLGRPALQFENGCAFQALTGLLTLRLQ